MDSGSMDLHADDPFFSVEQTQHDTSAGTVGLPILYFDVRNVVAFFITDRDRIENALRNTPYEPGLILGSKAFVGLSMYEYRHTSIGAYNEVALAIPVLRKGAAKPLSRLLDNYRSLDRRKLGFFVLNLPVTTEAANVAGRELWGLPKFVTGIPFNLGGKKLQCVVKDPATDRSIIEVSGKIGVGVPVPPLSLLIYSQLDGGELRTSVNVRGRLKAALSGTVQLRVGDSNHRMAESVRSLGLNGTKPLFVMHTNDFQSRLNAGVRITESALPPGAEI